MIFPRHWGWCAGELRVVSYVSRYLLRKVVDAANKLVFVRYRDGNVLDD